MKYFRADLFKIKRDFVEGVSICCKAKIFLAERNNGKVVRSYCLKCKNWQKYEWWKKREK